MANCSKTLDFCKEFDRLCNAYNMECVECPLEHSNYDCSGYGVTQEAIDIVQKWSDENPYIPKLKPCPFCGKTETPHVFEEMDYKQKYDYYKNKYRVVCDYTEGGCGASTGYAKTKSDAIEKWNTRAEED